MCGKDLRRNSSPSNRGYLRSSVPREPLITDHSETCAWPTCSWPRTSDARRSNIQRRHLHLSACEGLSQAAGPAPLTQSRAEVPVNFRAAEAATTQRRPQTHRRCPGAPQWGQAPPAYSSSLLGDTPLTATFSSVSRIPALLLQSVSRNYHQICLRPEIPVLASASGETHTKTKLKLKLPFDPTVPFLGLYPKKISTSDRYRYPTLQHYSQ